MQKVGYIEQTVITAQYLLLSYLGESGLLGDRIHCLFEKQTSKNIRTDSSSFQKVELWSCDLG